ncbi:adenylosuccinate synthetase [bacterium]|nr:adenylosuccinate synthetase [bacterium]
MFFSVPLNLKIIFSKAYSSFLDVLSNLKSIKVCTHYEYNGELIDYLPFDASALNQNQVLGGSYIYVQNSWWSDHDGLG